MFFHRTSVLSLSLGALLVLIACEGTAQQSRESNQSREPRAASTTQSEDSVRRVTVTELQQALEKNEAIVVDVRGQSAYEASHIKGARSIPLGEVAQRAGELPRDKMIVTYCS